MASQPHPFKLSGAWRGVLQLVFIDNPWLGVVWHCHQRPDRSFFLNGRQFHVCARCTGLLTGLLASPLCHLAPGSYMLGAGTVFLIANAVDGGTQWVGLRTSTNALRLVLGLGLGATALTTLRIAMERTWPW